MIQRFAAILFLFSFLGSISNYEIDTLYKYNYVTSILLKENNAKKGNLAPNAVDYKITYEVELASIWQNEKNLQEKLFRIMLKEVQIKAISNKGKSYSSTIDKIINIPIYILWDNGIIKKTYIVNNDAANLLKGIASNFQIQTNNIEISEIDVSGECKVQYTVNNDKIKKQKLHCTHPEVKNWQYLHPNKIQSPTVKFTSEAEFETLNKNKILKNIVGKELLKVDATLWKDAAIAVTSVYELNLQNQEKINFEKIGNTLEEVLSVLSKENELIEDSLIAKSLKFDCKENCKTLSNLVTDFKSQLKASELSSFEAASSFVKLLEKFRLATKEELLEILKNRKNNDIIPQILDLISAAQTDTAYDAAIAFLDFSGKNIDLAERFLLGLSITSHPTDKIITTLLSIAKKKLNNEKLRTTLIMSIGSIINAYCKKDSSNFNSKIVSEVINYFSNKLKNCKKINCKLIYLRGFKNAALPSTIPILLEYARKGNPFAEIALSAIKKMDPKHIDEMVISVLYELYYETEKKQDSTVRILAAELLLSSRFNDHVIDDLLFSFIMGKKSEISTYVIGKIFDLSNRDKNFREMLKSSKVRNYNSLSNTGNSAVVRNLLSGETGVNIFYSMDMEMILGGLLKRSAVNVHFENKDDKLQFFSIGLFASGLASIAGEESSDQDSEETSAGMELTILGVDIRPYTFFHGTGELMSHVWSGTGSEPISAIQGNLLLMDYSELIFLQNGLIIDTKVKGAISLDLSAKIDISIWNRNSHSVVKNSGAFAIEGIAKIDSSFIQSQIEFSLGGESYIDFITDFDFYDTPYKTCLQMNQPDLIITYNLKKSHTLQENKWQVSSNRKYYIPGKSYSFHKKNAVYCSVLLAET